MKRFTRQVQCDECPTCHRGILTTNWDDQWAVQDSIVADPTPLTQQEEMACILLGRSRYVLEQTVAKTFRLGRITEYLGETRVFLPALHLPAHRCGARFSQPLPAEVALTLCPVVREVDEATGLVAPPF